MDKTGQGVSEFLRVFCDKEKVMVRGERGLFKEGMIFAWERNVSLEKNVCWVHDV